MEGTTFIQQSKENYADLEKAISLSEVDISGDDSERQLLSPCNWLGKPELQNFSCLTFVADMGEPVSQRMFPSEYDLLKIALKIHI